MDVMQKAKHHEAAPPCYSQIGDDQCTGCAACANGCHRSAIEMKLNREGFYRPVLRNDLCNDCVACLHHCPVITVAEQNYNPADPPDVYAAWSTDEGVHLSSSSGGIFSELARHVLDHSGVVCGCDWGENWTPRHVMAKTWADITRLRGSKYIPSFVGDQFYREVIDLAKAGITVLFCGTPCQVAGLDLITPPEARANLLLVDLVCHGVPSLTSFWRYLDWKFGDKDRLKQFSFRNKEISIQTICAFTDSGSKFLVPCYQDPWFATAMIYHAFLQRSCFQCHFRNLPRRGDISLGDFWGISDQWHDPRGDSVVFANTEKGKVVLRQLLEEKQIIAKTSDYTTASRSNGQLRGVVYPVPVLRNLSLRFLTDGKSFVWIYRLCYLPLRFVDRLFSFTRRRTLIVSRICRQILGRG